MRKDVVVIGGGIAGLATGALLAKRGYRTAVLEKGNQPGGRAYTYTDKEFTLNFGPHAVYRPESGLLSELMRRLDRPVPRCFYPDPMRAWWSDGDRLGAIGAKPHQILASRLLPLGSKLRLGPLMLAIRGEKRDGIAPDLTWGEWLDAHTSDVPLRRFILALSTVNTYTRNPGELSARLMLKQLQENLFAKDYAGYMGGGWSSMYEAFIGALREHGGRLVTQARVDTLELRDGRVTAVVAGGERYEAEAFVCAAPPQDAASLAPGSTPLRTEFERHARLRDVRATCIDLGFDRRLRTDLTFLFDIDRDLYFSLHSEVTPDLAPKGGQLLHAMAYLSENDTPSDAALERRRAELLAGLDRFFPGWREAAGVERVLPNARVTPARRTPDQPGVPLRAEAAANLYFANDARDLPYMLSLTSMAAAMEVADVIAREVPLGPLKPELAAVEAR